jgi:antitoxin component of MazEF toxin-antitoxin module
MRPSKFTYIEGNTMAEMTRRVALRQAGGSSILTIPKEFVKAFGASKAVLVTQLDNGSLSITAENQKIDVLAALEQLDVETVKRMANSTGFDSIKPLGKEVW